MSGKAATAGRVRVWDLPIRVGHWLLVGLVGVSWYAAETRHMDWHRWSGYGVIAVLLFRLYWGIVGSSTARFATFVKGPRSTLRYVADLWAASRSAIIGHNPLGALSVLAMLASLLVQVATGLISVDVDGFESGPLSDRVDFEVGRRFAHWHEGSFGVLLTLVLLHLVAVAFYLIRKRSNLVGPMITGWGTGGDSVRLAPWWRAVPGLVLAVAVAWFIASGMRI